MWENLKKPCSRYYSSVNQDFYGKIVNNTEITSEDVQKYLMRLVILPKVCKKT